MTDKTNLSVFPGSMNISPEALLEIAKYWDIDEIVIIGIKFTDEGTDTMVAASCNDLHRNLGFIECAKDELLRMRSRVQDYDDGDYPDAG